jgi:hypothetical protein
MRSVVLLMMFASYVDYIFNGFRDKAGNFAVFDGKTWKGLRDDERVAQIDLGLPA